MSRKQQHSNPGRLDRVEVQNFKSYAGFQVIGPFKNITCVIGPNGSGKSNLMDAISFVVGVASSVLRGADLQDLRYRGNAEAAQRDPSCFVRLVHVSDDGEETVFQRTIKEKGGTDYKIDGKTVSYEDYNKQLMAIGIHAKARNFLVFQNEITAIASKSPKEITQLFERVSGSEEFAEEYERLKGESEKAQERVILELKKVNMIKQHKKSKKEQKKEAERYEELQGELNTEKLNNKLFELSILDKEIGEFQQQIVDEKNELEKLPRKQKEDEKVTLTKKKATLGKEMQTLEKSIKDKDKALDKEAQPQYKAKEAFRRWNDDLKKFGEELTRAQKADKLRDQQKAENEAELAKVQQEISELEKSQQKRNDLAKASSIDEYNRLKIEVNERSFQINQQLQTERQALERLQLDVGRERQLLQSEQATLVLNKKYEEELNKKLGDDSSDGDGHKKRTKELQTALKMAKGELEKKQQRHNDLAKELQTVNDTIGMIKVDNQDAKREAQMEEIVNELKNRFPGGVYGRLVNLYKPRRDEYLLPTLVALGRNMDAVVVTKQSVAHECIQFLKEKRHRPITFLPMDSLDVKDISSIRVEVRQGTKFMIDAVDCDAEVKRAFQYAFGPTLLLKDEQEGTAMCLGEKRRKGVTEKGTMFSKNGLITGGTSSLKQRGDIRKEAEAKARRDEIRKELDSIDIDKLVRSVDLYAQELRTFEADAGRKEQSKGSAQEELKRLMAEMNARTDRIKEIQKRIQELETEINSHEQKMSSARRQLDNISGEVYKSFCSKHGIANINEFMQSEAESSEVTKKRSDLMKTAARLRNDLSRWAAKRQERSTQDIEENIQTAKTTVADFQKKVNEFEKKIKKLEEEKKELEEQKQQKREAETEIDGILKKNEKAYKEMTDAVAKIEARISFAHGNIEKLRGNKKRMFDECRLERIELPFVDDEDGEDGDGSDEEEEDRGDPMEVDEGPESSQALRYRKKRDQEMKKSLDYRKLPKPYRNVTTDARIQEVKLELHNKITQLQDEIMKLNPNMKAAEQLAEITKELAEATATFEQCRGQSKLAAEQFKQVQESRIEKFEEFFQAMSLATNVIYQELNREEGMSLYSGGSAYLHCENPQEPYLGGIKYDTMPPGKKFMDMEHLSGGEKTVAALALIFAIHSHCPSPFLVLDEVDAALDAHNIEKVTRYIKSRKDDLQCIIISLKERFYENADGLIGICKEPSEAFSRTLSLDLTQYR